MGSRNVEIKLISALDLYCPNWFSYPEPYAIAWISDDPTNKHYSPVDRSNGINPRWNQVMKFIVDEAALQQDRLVLEIKIYTTTRLGKKEMGQVSIPLNEFLKLAGGNKGATTYAQEIRYQVLRSPGKVQGCIYLSGAVEAETVMPYPAGPCGASNVEPVTGYSAYLRAGSSSQPPPYLPQNNQYPSPPYPPQAGYPPPPPHYQAGYPPPPPHYPTYQGYPAVVLAAQQPPRNNNISGMGLVAMGTTLFGDAFGLGGLLGDDVVNGYEGGFDGGDV